MEDCGARAPEGRPVMMAWWACVRVYGKRAAKVAVLSCVVCPGQLSEPRGRGAWCAAMRRVAVRGYRGLRTFRAC